jgi:hypothetical protein
MKRLKRILYTGLFLLPLCSCSESTPPLSTATPTAIPSRYSRISETAEKMGPDNDRLPPIIHSAAWEEPIPMPGPINSPGGEDSPFITPDGKDFYFFFTPDVSIPAEKQVLDGVTGIYKSRWVNDSWTDPERVILNDDLALDGCPFVLGNQLWFCTARVGYTGLHWFKAYYENGAWGSWELEDFIPLYDVGELHITADGKELYYHSSQGGGLGANDIWVSRKENGSWGEPHNLTLVNSQEDDSRPFVSEDSQQLWFTRTYQGYPAVFVSYKENGIWQEPILIVSQFAAEPTLDNAGNLYFIHHFIWDGVMLDADVYLAKKK